MRATQHSHDTSAQAEPPYPSVWSRVSKDERYLSDWEDDVIRYEAKDEDAKTSVIGTVDLNKALLAITGGIGIFRGGPIPLLDFPDFVNALKIAINRTLRTNTTTIKSHVSTVFHHCIRFFYFLINRGIYRLSDAGRDACELYKRRVLELGWWKANSYNMLLRRVLRAIQHDRPLQERLYGRTNGAQSFFPFNFEELERTVGLPIPTFALPTWFYIIFRKITGESKPYSSSDRANIRPGHTSSCLVFASINYLYFRMDGIDSLKFNPFPRPLRIADEHFKTRKATDGRTANLSIPSAIKIIDESLRWLYDYGPTLIFILQGIRAKIEEVATTATSVQDERREAMIRSFCKEKFAQFQSLHNLDLSGTPKPVVTEASVKSLVFTYQSALFFIIAACHARRRNEIVGRNKDYGLYLGCVQEASPGSNDYKVDVYIEKTLRDYQEYWISELVAKSIFALEELFQIFRPLNSVKLEYQENVEDARHNKLFRSKHLTYAGFKTDAYIGFDLPTASSLLLRFSGVDAKEVFDGNRNVFRRFYCIVYVHRYDHPVLAALRLHLDHSNVHATAIYGLDPHGRNPKKKSAVLLKRTEQDEIDFEETMSEVRAEHHMAKLLALLKGERVGGLYGRLVLKLVARLSTDVKFVASPTEVKAEITAQRMAQRGFLANEKDNGICMAGNARHTARKAHCSDGSTVHPERAGPAICSGCINLMTSEGYRSHMASERDALLARAADLSLPRACREGLRRDARDIKDFLEADEKIVDGNRRIVIRLVQQWSDLHVAASK